MQEELKTLTGIYTNNLRVTIEPFYSDIYPSMTFRIDDPDHDYHIKYELPLIQWQTSAVQEPDIISMTLAKMVNELLNTTIVHPNK